MMGTVRRVCRNVKRWRNAAMALRWTAAGMMEAAKGFRRLKAYKQLPVLRAALAAHQSKYVTQRVEHDADADSIIHGDACFAYFNKIWGIPFRAPENGRHVLRAGAAIGIGVACAVAHQAAGQDKFANAADHRHAMTRGERRQLPASV